MKSFLDFYLYFTFIDKLDILCTTYDSQNKYVATVQLQILGLFSILGFGLGGGGGGGWVQRRPHGLGYQT